LLCVVVTWLVAPAAWAGPGWLPLVEHTSTAVVETTTEVDGDGRAFRVSLGGADTGRQYVQVAVKEPGQPWGQPQAVSFNDTTQKYPMLGVARTGGRAMIVWNACTFGGTPVTPSCTLHSSVRRANGVWGVDTVIGGTIPAVVGTAVAVAPNGNAMLLTTIFGVPGGSPLHAYSWSDSGGWSSGTPLGTGGGSGNLQAAFDDAGTAHAVWEDPSGPNILVRAATRPAGQAWGTPALLSNPGQHSTWPALKVTADGRALVAWSQRAIYFSERAPGGSWTPRTELTDPGIGASAYTAQTPSVAVNSRGDVMVAWYVYNAVSGLQGQVQATERRAGQAAWVPPLPLSSPTEDAWQPQVGLADSGAAVVTWTSRPAAVRGAVRSAGGEWETGGPDVGPERDWVGLTMDRAGNAIVSWGYGSLTYERVFDAAAPVIAEVSVPEEAAVGQRVSMFAAAVDMWSAPEAISWDFGDGTRAEGDLVEHAYAHPGTYTVEVRAVDALGNASTQQRQVVVPAPPVVDPPITLPNDPVVTVPPSVTATPDAPAVVKEAPRALADLAVVWLTRAQLNRRAKTLGVVVGVTGIPGLPAGTKITLACAKGCRLAKPRSFLTRAKESPNKVRLRFSPALKVTAKTQLTVTAERGGHLTRQVRFRFVRQRGAVLARRVSSTCLDGRRALPRCPG
jgi:hypothetical protein